MNVTTTNLNVNTIDYNQRYMQAQQPPIINKRMSQVQMAQEQTALMAVTKESWNNGMHAADSQRTIDQNL